MKERREKELAFLSVLRSFQDRLEKDPRFLNSDQRRQLKKMFISFFAPDLSREQLIALKEEEDFDRFLARLINIIETNETLAEQVAEEVLTREGVVPDKITLAALVAEMEAARLEAAQARKEAVALADRLVERFGFSRPAAEKTTKVLIGQARFSDTGEKRDTKQALAAAKTAVSGGQGADVVLKAVLELKVMQDSFNKLGFEAREIKPLTATLAVANLPPGRKASLDSSLPSEVRGAVQLVEKELSGLSPEQIQAIGRASNYQEKLNAAREASSELAPQLVALLEIKMALGRFRALPDRTASRSVFTGIKRLVSESLGPVLNQGVGPETAREIEGAAAQILISPPGWADFARQTAIDQLPTIVKDALGQKAGPKTIADIERISLDFVSRPETAESWLFSLEDESLDGVYRLKTFFRSPSENDLLVGRIDKIISAGERNPWITPLQHQRQLIKTTSGSFPYRLRWGMGKLFAPAKRITRGLSWPARAIGLNRLPGVRWFSSRLGGRFSRWRQRGISWLARKAAGWGAKALAKQGGRWAISAGLKGGLTALAEGVGLAGGPPGWLVTALIWGGGLLKKIGGRLTGWLGDFNPANLVFGARRANAKGDRETWAILAAVVVGLPILIVVLVIFGVVTVVSSFWVSNQELGGVGVDQAYLSAIAANRIDCSAVGAAPTAQRACRLENLIKGCVSADKGGVPRVSRDNISEVKTCLRGKGIDPDTVEQLSRSVAGAYALDYNLQCVGFLKAAYPQLRQYPVAGAKDFYDILGGSHDLAGVEPGDVMVASSGQYGHAAIVTGVDLPNEAGGEMFVRLTQADGYSGGVFTSKLSLTELEVRGFVILNIE